MVEIKNIICKYNNSSYIVKTTNRNISTYNILSILKKKYNVVIPNRNSCIIIDKNNNKLIGETIELFDNVYEILIMSMYHQLLYHRLQLQLGFPTHRNHRHQISMTDLLFHQ